MILEYVATDRIKKYYFIQVFYSSALSALRNEYFIDHTILSAISYRSTRVDLWRDEFEDRINPINASAV